jgi:hypothetical protein
MLYSKQCLLSCVVGLTWLTTPREWSTLRNTDPVGVKGRKLQGPSKGHGLKVSMSKAVLILQVLGPQGSRDPGSMVGSQGFRRSPFMDLGFQGHQRAKRLRVSRDRGFSPCYPWLSKGLMFSNPRVLGSEGWRFPGLQGFRGMEGLPFLTRAFR